MNAQKENFLLAVEGLTVSFDGFKAVDDLSFYLDPKENWFLMSRPRCGDDVGEGRGKGGGSRPQTGF